MPQPTSVPARPVPTDPPSAARAARGEIVVDLDAVSHNVHRLREVVSAERPVQMMTVVKADGYGHGMVPVARTARAAGADWLGVATLDEALALRASGDTGPVLCWLTVPGEDYAAAIAADVDVTAYSVAELDEVAAAVTGRPARVQVKVDTGLSRGGAARADWERVLRRVVDLQEEGRIRLTGLWSHLACADEPEHPSNAAQEAAFREALDLAHGLGLRPDVTHLANSAAAVLRPWSRYDLVRCGIASYGLDPAPGHTRGLGLRPAMTVRSRLVMSKPIEAGAGVSYGHTWVAPEATTVGVVPVGYAEGVPRDAGNAVSAWVTGRRRPVRGRVCMDQLVLDLDGELVPAGAEVVLFGPGDAGEPTAQDWADATGTITYEIVTRVGGRMVRSHRGGATAAAGSGAS